MTTPDPTPTPSLSWARAAPEGETGPGPWIEIAFGPGEGPEDPVYLRETSDPDTVVTTNRRKWDAFVLGVQAGEFDHFIEGIDQ
ncbi:DUF397 domain-containing protein [Streptomyces sp. NPDC021093]|uniref:DUF397 domain-containing protein n=1 Tax=Streptomyces sp. NPDC021093 TaxID=3365112 RepID=UPI0037B539BE